MPAIAPFPVLDQVVLIPPRILAERAAMHPGILLGAGLGGLADGIVLHQILRWHSVGLGGEGINSPDPAGVLEAITRAFQINGAFQVVLLALAIVGSYRMVSAARRGALVPNLTALSGQMLIGWGVFNLLEPLIDRFVLARQAAGDRYALEEWALVVIGGIGFLVAGWWMTRRNSAPLMSQE